MAFVYEHPVQMQELNSKMPIGRISSLPDELLINILNFLPTKYAVITSILSRRWCHLFKEVTHLDFDVSHLFNHLSGLNCEESDVAFRAVYKLLVCLKFSILIKFHIKCTLRCESCVPETVWIWLSAILYHSHGIQEIDLCIDGPVAFPRSLFTCKTLCILKLTCTSTVLNIPGTVYLPCLKILYLHQITVVDVNLISRVFSGCPSLQEFIMDPLNRYIADQLVISAPSLRDLMLGNGKYFDDYDIEPMDLVAITAPLLQCFHYADKLAKSYSIKTSNYLVEAHLEIFILPGDFEDSTVSRSSRDLVQGVSTVKRLFLSAGCIKALTLLKDELPILRNLTTLKIGCPTNPHLTLLRLLRSAPNLEELIFSEGLFRVGFKDIDTVQQDYWGRGRVVPSCLKMHLKVIEIEHFLGLKEELRIVDFLLRNSHVLDQLIIHKWVGSKGKFKISKQLKRLAKRWNKSVNFNELFL